MPIIVCAKSTPKRGRNELHWIWGTFPTSILCTKHKNFNVCTKHTSFQLFFLRVYYDLKFPLKWNEIMSAGKPMLRTSWNQTTRKVCWVLNTKANLDGILNWASHTPSIKMKQNSIHWPWGMEKWLNFLMDSNFTCKFTWRRQIMKWHDIKSLFFIVPIVVSTWRRPIVPSPPPKMDLSHFTPTWGSIDIWITLSTWLTYCLEQKTRTSNWDLMWFWSILLVVCGI